MLSQKRGQPFAFQAVVLQGSVLSPILYSNFLDPLVDSLKHGPMMNLPFQSEGINCLLYADSFSPVTVTGTCRLESESLILRSQ